jgi:drug/metabolite transporter (DMT)-like permease
MVGFLGIAGQSLITHGVTIAETTVVLPFDYLRIVYAAGFGVLLFNEVPGPWSIAGTVIIVASTLYILLLEAKKKSAKR